LFTIEATIKIVAKGLLFNNLGPVLPYLKSYWNLLDAFVVIASLLDLITRLSGMNLQSLQALKALRALRALRPLRIISRNEGMRLVTNALIASLPSMTNVLLVCSLFILIFGIMGVGFFKGQFYHCEDNFDADFKIDMNLIDTKDDCLIMGGLWVNKNSHFDNTPQAMMTLF
jgi:voltage-dependent calcium channel T type alpha-1G